MANHTENLNLYEIDKVNDTFNTFDIDTVLNENWQKIDEKTVNKNGTVPFVAEQIGVDPLSEQGIATKHYVDTNALKLGETETTAYRGDRGKIAYEHSQALGNPHETTKTDIGLSNVQNIDTTTTVNITDSFDKRFVTDAEKTKLNNTSGVNTGDETKESIETKLGDDFTNLVKKDGTVSFIAEQQGITPTQPDSLATKAYVDSICSITTCNNVICSNQTIPPSGIEYTLSFLPNDNGVYELFLCGNAVTSGGSPYPQLGVISSYMQAGVSLFGGYSSSSFSITGNGIAFTNDRKITVCANYGNPIMNLTCYAYRKIG